MDGDSGTREQTRNILLQLTEVERRLLSAVLRVERDNLHLQKPHVREPLLKAVREIVK